MILILTELILSAILCLRYVIGVYLGMVFHHMGAVMMSQQLIVQGLDEHCEVYLLARSIRDSQRQEIFMMRDWLDSWY